MKALDYIKAVKSLKDFHSDLYRFLVKVKINKDTNCWEWVGAMWSGYGKFKFNGAFEGAHRVSYQFFVGEIEDGMVICHKCDNPKCVNPDHLFVGTQSDNMIDALNKGRVTVPIGTPYQKDHKPMNRGLSDDVVRMIKAELTVGDLSMPKIAERFGAKYQTIRDIKAGRAYTGVI